MQRHPGTGLWGTVSLADRAVGCSAGWGRGLWVRCQPGRGYRVQCQLGWGAVGCRASQEGTMGCNCSQGRGLWGSAPARAEGYGVQCYQGQGAVGTAPARQGLWGPLGGAQEGGHTQTADVWCHHSEMAVQGCPAMGTAFDTHHPPSPAPKGAGPALSTQNSCSLNPLGQGFAAPSLFHSEDQNPPALCDLCRGGCTPRAGPGQHITALSRLSPPSPAAKHPSSFQPVSFPATAASSVPVPVPGTEGFTVPCQAASGDIWGLGDDHGLPKGVTVTDC